MHNVYSLRFSFIKIINKVYLFIYFLSVYNYNYIIYIILYYLCYD